MADEPLDARARASDEFRVREDFGEEERFDPKLMPTKYPTNPKPGHAFVHVSTIQRMAINVLGRGAVFGGAEDVTEWKRRARWRQHRWALRQDLADHLGSQPYDGKPPKRKDGRVGTVVKVGSRIELMSPYVPVQ